MKVPKPSFSSFLNAFAVQELPVTLTEENMIIHIIEGEQPASVTQYVPNLSRAYQMEIRKSGEVGFLEGEVLSE